MKPNRLICCAGLLACLMPGGLSARALPNIVVVAADDLGPGDIGFYHRQRTGKDAVIPTPNIYRLIGQGMRFDDAHSAAPLCAPSRFGMLTGNYSYRNYWPCGVWAPWEKTGLNPRSVTSARLVTGSFAWLSNVGQASSLSVHASSRASADRPARAITPAKCPA